MTSYPYRLDYVPMNYRYADQDLIVDQVFPHIGGPGGLDPELDGEKYSTFAFWKDPLMDAESLGLQAFIYKTEDELQRNFC